MRTNLPIYYKEDEAVANLHMWTRVTFKWMKWTINYIILAGQSAGSLKIVTGSTVLYTVEARM